MLFSIAFCSDIKKYSLCNSMPYNLKFETRAPKHRDATPTPDPTSKTDCPLLAGTEAARNTGSVAAR